MSRFENFFLNRSMYYASKKYKDGSFVILAQTGKEGFVPIALLWELIGYLKTHDLEFVQLIYDDVEKLDTGYQKKDFELYLTFDDNNRFFAMKEPDSLLFEPDMITEEEMQKYLNQLSLVAMKDKKAYINTAKQTVQKFDGSGIRDITGYLMNGVDIEFGILRKTIVNIKVWDTFLFDDIFGIMKKYFPKMKLIEKKRS